MLLKKISIILVILVAVGVVYSGVLLIAKHTSYQAGLERKLPIHGTYRSADEIEPAYLTIAYEGNRHEFDYFKTDKQITQSGTVKKSDNNYYLLYDENHQLYGKVIPSYKKIYLIDKNLQITEFDSYSQDILISIHPAERQ